MKAEILGINKSPLVNAYAFKKEQGFIKNIIKFLLALNFTKKDAEYLFWNVECEYNPKAKEYINIKKVIDSRYNIKNRDYDIDIFIGHKKIFVVIRTKEDKQKEISRIISVIGRLKKN